MTWTEPTSKQIDQAVNHGIEYALDEINAGHRTEPQDGPLSGEWADGLTPRMVAGNVGYLEGLSAHGETYYDGETQLADAWERGYEDTWRTYLDNIQGGR
jgi:hypothetical protein